MDRAQVDDFESGVHMTPSYFYSVTGTRDGLLSGSPASHTAFNGIPKPCSAHPWRLLARPTLTPPCMRRLGPPIPLRCTTLYLTCTDSLQMPSLSGPSTWVVGQVSKNRRLPVRESLSILLCLLGQATVALTPFKHVTGVDPSENMIRSAREVLESTRNNDDADRPFSGPVIDFVQGSAETLDFLPDDSTDLVIAGTFGF